MVGMNKLAIMKKKTNEIRRSKIHNWLFPKTTVKQMLKS